MRIVFSGNLATYQGIELLLQSFRSVHENLPRSRLILITDSDLQPLTRKIAALGLTDCVSSVQADFAGLPAYLAEADVLVNPRTQCEGIPQKLLNYMAAGRPIVSFSGSAAPLEHERTALIVADGDTDGFAKAILRILSQPTLGRRLAKAAQQDVIANYGWQIVAETVEDVYLQLTEKNSRAR